jgi:hypothetical protein
MLIRAPSRARRCRFFNWAIDRDPDVVGWAEWGVGFLDETIEE